MRNRKEPYSFLDCLSAHWDTGTRDLQELARAMSFFSLSDINKNWAGYGWMGVQIIVTNNGDLFILNLLL